MDKCFLVEFIEAYRNFPCLWQIKSNEYKDRNKKNRAYEELLNKYKEVDQSATIQTVKTKIDSLRGSFRKEIRKIKDSLRSGAGEDEVYKPHLWYYEHLLVLLDQGTPRQSVSSHDTECLHNNEVSLLKIRVYQSLHIFKSSYLKTRFFLQDEELESQADSLSTEASSSQSSKSTFASPPMVSPSCPQINVPRSTLKRKILEKVSHQLDYVKEDKFDIIGKNIANKLRELPSDIATVTEKLLNDIAFEAQMGNITRQTKVILQETTSHTIQNQYHSSAKTYHSLMPIQASEHSDQASKQKGQPL